MTAGFARSVAEACGSGSVTSEKCRALIRANHEQKARMYVAGSRCASACVYALLGAPVRQVPDTVNLGIHASTALIEETPQGAISAWALQDDMSWKWVSTPRSSMQP